MKRTKNNLFFLMCDFITHPVSNIIIEIANLPSYHVSESDYLKTGCSHSEIPRDRTFGETIQSTTCIKFKE